MILHKEAVPFSIADYKSILCLNGSLPSPAFFQQGLPIVAADGAANTLMEMGIKPMMVVGDLDSVLPHYLTILPSFYHQDQNYCDFQKSLWYLEKEQLLPTIVVGINGGHIDHILNNINLFLHGHHLLYAPPLYGFAMQAGESRSLSLPLDTKISLLGIPCAAVSSQGLKWELDHDVLSFPGRTSCFNRTNKEQVTLQVDEGNVLILIYTEIMT